MRLAVLCVTNVQQSDAIVGNKNVEKKDGLRMKPPPVGVVVQFTTTQSARAEEHSDVP